MDHRHGTGRQTVSQILPDQAPVWKHRKNMVIKQTLKLSLLGRKYKITEIHENLDKDVKSF